MSNVQQWTPRTLMLHVLQQVFPDWSDYQVALALEHYLKTHNRKIPELGAYSLDELVPDGEAQEVLALLEKAAAEALRQKAIERGMHKSQLFLLPLDEIELFARQQIARHGRGLVVVYPPDDPEATMEMHFIAPDGFKAHWEGRGQRGFTDEDYQEIEEMANSCDLSCEFVVIVDHPDGIELMKLRYTLSEEAIATV